MTLYIVQHRSTGKFFKGKLYYDPVYMIRHNLVKDESKARVFKKRGHIKGAFISYPDFDKDFVIITKELV